MTKEQFLNKWVVISVVRDKMLPDLEAVIATEIAKVKVKPQPEELKGNCSTFDMSRLVDQVQPAPQVKTDLLEIAISDVFDSFKKIEETKKQMEQEKIQHDAEQPAKPFDRDRFERMFRAVVASGRTERWEQDFKFTEEALAKLDAYYAEKQGGAND